MAQVPIATELLNSTCECVESILDNNHDKISFSFGYENCFNEVYYKSIGFSAPDSTDLFLESFFNSISANCMAYDKAFEIINRYSQEQIESRVKNPKDCELVKSGLFEDNVGGENVLVSMQDSIQVVTFGDEGLYTKSNIIWHDECTYTLVFVESTNPLEITLMAPGDERKVRIVEINNQKEFIYEVEMFERWFLGRFNRKE